MGATTRGAGRLFGWWLACLAGLLVADWDGLHAGAAAQPWLARSVQALSWAVAVAVFAAPLLGLALVLAGLGAWVRRARRWDCTNKAMVGVLIQVVLDADAGRPAGEDLLTGKAMVGVLAQVALDAGGGLQQAAAALGAAMDALENASSAKAETAAREARFAAEEALHGVLDRVATDAGGGLQQAAAALDAAADALKNASSADSALDAFLAETAAREARAAAVEARAVAGTLAGFEEGSE